MNVLSIDVEVQGRVIREIVRERERQEELKNSGKFLWTCADPAIANPRKLAVLAEEFGEAAREVTEEIIEYDKSGRATDDITGSLHDVAQAEARTRLRKELIQVAAVAVAWVEALDCDRSET